MSEENVEIVRAQYAAFGRLDADGIRSYVLSYFDPDCEYWPVEEIDAIRGHEALIEWIKRWLEAWSSFHSEVEEIIDAGEIVLAAVTSRARGRSSGIETREQWFDVYEMREGRILRSREYLDRDSALEAAGLSE